MKLTSLVILVTAPLIGAFSSSFTPGSTSLLSQSPASRHALSMEYIPSGMSKEQWRKVKEQEKNKMQGKNLGKVGITTFKSRSFADWQASGGKNLFPVDPRKVKDPREIPYMQRPGGRPDDSDLKNVGSNPFGSFFGAKTKKEEEPAAETKKQTNWWTLN